MLEKETADHFGPQQGSAFPTASLSAPKEHPPIYNILSFLHDCGIRQPLDSTDIHAKKKKKKA